MGRVGEWGADLCYITSLRSWTCLLLQQHLACLAPCKPFLSHQTSHQYCFIHLLIHDCDFSLPPSVLQALKHDKTIRFKAKQRQLRGTEGIYCYSKPITNTGPEFAQSFYRGTRGAVWSSCQTPWQRLRICIGRSFARWLKCSCSYFVLMQTDISSSSCSGFLLWGRSLHFHRKNFWLPIRSPPCSFCGAWIG